MDEPSMHVVKPEVLRMSLPRARSTRVPRIDIPRICDLIFELPSPSRVSSVSLRKHSLSLCRDVEKALSCESSICAVKEGWAEMLLGRG